MSQAKHADIAEQPLLLDHLVFAQILPDSALTPEKIGVISLSFRLNGQMHALQRSFTDEFMADQQSFDRMIALQKELLLKDMARRVGEALGFIQEIDPRGPQLRAIGAKREGTRT